MHNYAAYRLDDFDRKLSRAGFRPLDLLVCGPTGVGKSSTLNALLAANVAACAGGAASCTQEIASYELSECLHIWDTPGLGDGVEQDLRFTTAIADCLRQTCMLGNRRIRRIDMALVLLEARSRSLYTPIRLLKDILLPCLDASRIILAVNQADMALCGWHWDDDAMRPDNTLKATLEERTLTLWQRLREDTGQPLARPVFFSALHDFNLTALLDVVLDRLPGTPRAIL